MSIVMGITFGIIWAALGLVGFFRCLRLDKDAGFVPSRKEYIILIPGWALIGPLGLYGVWVSENTKGKADGNA